MPRDALQSSAVLPHSAIRLPFATSPGLSTLYYWWLNFQAEQYRGYISVVASNTDQKLGPHPRGRLSTLFRTLTGVSYAVLDRFYVVANMFCTIFK